MDRELHPCGACSRLGDGEPKECRKCTPCGEWLCDKCWGSVPRRAAGATLKLVEFVKKKTSGMLTQPKLSLPLSGRGVHAPKAKGVRMR